MLTSAIHIQVLWSRHLKNAWLTQAHCVSWLELLRISHMWRYLVTFKNSSIKYSFSETNVNRTPLSEDLLGLVIYTTHFGKHCSNSQTHEICLGWEFRDGWIQGSQSLAHSVSAALKSQNVPFSSGAIRDSEPAQRHSGTMGVVLVEIHKSS